MKINTKAIEAELQELAGALKVRVKADRHQKAVASICCNDNGYAISLNPSKIRCQTTLENQLDFCRQEVSGLGGWQPPKEEDK